MLVLGVETSCDETGVALYDSTRGLLGHALHSQMAMHEAYGGVVPELASRDHIRRVVPLIEGLLLETGTRIGDLDGIAYTQGPGLAGALLVGASVATALGFALGKPAIRRPSSRSASAVAAARRARSRRSRSSRCWYRADTPSSMPWRTSATTLCWATPSTTRPARHSTRPRRCSASAIRAVRRWRSSPRVADRGPLPCRGR